MSQIEAVIFDMDGVIVDSEPYHDQSFLEIWQEMGYGDCHGIHLPDFYGRSDRVLWEAFIEKHHLPQPIEQLIGLRQQRLIQLLRDKRPIFDGVPELVQRLAKRLAETPEPGTAGRLLDNTTIVWTNELGKGNSHTLRNIPFVLIGSGRGFQMGRARDFEGVAHNRFLMTMAHGVGHRIDSFGNKSLSQGRPLDLS